MASNTTELENEGNSSASVSLHQSVVNGSVCNAISVSLDVNEPFKSMPVLIAPSAVFAPPPSSVKLPKNQYFHLRLHLKKRVIPINLSGGVDFHTINLQHKVFFGSNKVIRIEIKFFIIILIDLNNLSFKKK